MARKYDLKKRLDKSYEAYLRKRQVLKDKGIALADKMSKKEYRDTYKNFKEAGMSNNFARTMAYDDMRIDRNQAREIYKQMDEVVKNKFNINSVKELRGAPNVHGIISYMFDAGLIDDRDDFEKSLGY